MGLGRAEVRAAGWALRNGPGIAGNVIGTGVGIGRAGAGAARMGANVAPMAYNALIKSTPHGPMLRTWAQVGVGGIAAGSFAYGIMSQRNKNTYGPSVEVNTGGLPEIRKNGDLGATGALNFSLRNMNGNFL